MYGIINFSVRLSTQFIFVRYVYFPVNFVESHCVLCSRGLCKYAEVRANSYGPHPFCHEVLFTLPLSVSRTVVLCCRVPQCCCFVSILVYFSFYVSITSIVLVYMNYLAAELIVY